MVFAFYESLEETFEIITFRIPFPNLSFCNIFCTVQVGVAIAGGNGPGNESNQLENPHGIAVDEDQTVYIADRQNHRIMSWKADGTTTGQVVGGGKGSGNGFNQLNRPTDVIIDNDSLIICDRGNSRVMRWSRQHGNTSPTNGTVIIDNIACYGLGMDKQGSLYVSDDKRHEVRRYDSNKDGGYTTAKGTVVAGSGRRGEHLNQFNEPRYIFVDGEQSLYASDLYNHRVMKWVKNATQGIIVAGGKGTGRDLTQLFGPRGVWVDASGTTFVVEEKNNRITHWYKGKTKGTVIVGGNGAGKGENQLNDPASLSFDRCGNLYVADKQNNRVQRYSMKII